jgi:glycosyltransferase involved in cell wall biosynthesis
MSTLNADINLAPLHPSQFNSCRSGIRMYEAAAAWKPAATLAEATGPYLDDITDGENGYLFSTPEEFYEKLASMIENMSETKRVAANAKDWVRTNRDPYKHVPNLIEAFQRLRDIRRAVSVQPPPMEEKEPQSNEPVPAVDPDLRGSENGNSLEGVEAEHSGVPVPGR